MIDREALEFHENDSNPFAVDPRLTEEPAEPQDGAVLEYKRRITWKMLSLRQIAVFFAAIVAFYMLLVALLVVFLLLFTNESHHLHLLWRVSFLASGFMSSLATILVAIQLLASRFSMYTLRIGHERIHYRFGIFVPKRYFTYKTRIAPCGPETVFSPSLEVCLFKYGIMLRRNFLRTAFFPCGDAVERDRILREIDDFLYGWQSDEPAGGAVDRNADST